MPTLNDEMKTFIVKRLACYETPSRVAEAVKANFDIEISRQHVYAYDPDSSQQIAPRWKELHAATRQALLRDAAEIGIAHKMVRLRMLERLAHRYERHSVALALKCLEMAAKECGGMYENRKPIVALPTRPQSAVPEPAMSEPAAIQPAPPPAVPLVAIPLPSAPPPVMKQPSTPARAAPQPQAALPACATPSLSVPLPVVPQPDMAPPSPQPLAVLAQPPQTPALSAARPLSREERYLAYVRDRHARDRAIAAQARLDSGQSAPVPRASA